MKKEKTPWLPRKGKRVEVRHPVTGKMTGVSEHTGFKIMMTLAGVLVIIAVLIFISGH